MALRIVIKHAAAIICARKMTKFDWQNLFSVKIFLVRILKNI